MNLDSTTVTPQQRRASIVDAAIRILDRDGAGALNMRSLAEEMDLRPMAICHYVSGKPELLSMVIAEATGRVKWRKPRSGKSRKPRSGPRDRLLAQLNDTYAGLGCHLLATRATAPGSKHRTTALRDDRRLHHLMQRGRPH